MDVSNPIPLARLFELVGEEIGVSSWILVDQAKIDAFAEATGDDQFIHVDPVRAAAEAPFGGTIAHGFLVMSLMAAMGYEAIPTVSGTAMGINYGFDRLRFLTPVRAGSRVRGRFRLLSAEERRAGEITLKLGVEVEIEGEAKPAIAAEWLTRKYLRA